MTRRTHHSHTWALIHECLILVVAEFWAWVADRRGKRSAVSA